MIAPQELRQNNLLEYPGWSKDGKPKYFRVRDIFWEDNKIGLTDGIIQVPKTKLDNLKPIELTEEWLLKFGYGIDKEFDDHYIDNVSRKQEVMRYSTYAKVFTIESKGGDVVEIEMHYVHQLQNLFFALTGEELTIKEQP